MTQSETCQKVYERVIQFCTKQSIAAFYRALLKEFILGNQALGVPYGMPVAWVKGAKEKQFGGIGALPGLRRRISGDESRSALPEKRPA